MNFENEWSKVPGWRKAVAFLLFLAVLPSEQTIFRMMFHEDGSARR